MKKLLTILITILMLFAIVGCNTNKTTNSNDNALSNSKVKYTKNENGNYEAMFDYEIYEEYSLSSENKRIGTIKFKNQTNKVINRVFVHYLYDGKEGETVCINNRLEPGQYGYTQDLKIVNPDIEKIEITGFEFEIYEDNQDKIYDDIECTYEFEDYDDKYKWINLTVTNNSNKTIKYFVVEYISYKDEKLYEKCIVAQYGKEIFPGETIVINNQEKEDTDGMVLTGEDLAEISISASY